MAKLRYLNNEGQIECHQLGEGLVTIGRGDSCPLVIEDELASREHCRVEQFGDGQHKATDLGSRNKTYVNGQSITDVVLSHGDLLRIGETVFEYVVDDMPVALTMGEFFASDRTEPKHCQWVRIKDLLQVTTLQMENMAGLALGRAEAPRLEALTDRALAFLLVALKADRGFIALKTTSKRELNYLAVRGLAAGGEQPNALVSQYFVFASLLQQVAGRYPQETKHIAEGDCAGCAMAAPLVSGGKSIGVIYLDRPNAQVCFSEHELNFLCAAGAYLGALIQSKVKDVKAEAITDAQVWMPVLVRTRNALRNNSEATAGFEIAQQTFNGNVRCGDLFDWIVPGTQRLVVVAVDAGGRGMQGLMQGASVLTALRSTLALDDVSLDLGPTFNAINKSLCGRTLRQPIAAATVAIDLTGGRISYVNAGYVPPMVLAGPGRMVTLDNTTLLMGVYPDAIYEQTTVDLPPDFRLVLCSDGLVDATNTGLMMLSGDRLHDLLLERSSFTDTQAIVDKIAAAYVSHVGSAGQDDDASVLVVSRG